MKQKKRIKQNSEFQKTSLFVFLFTLIYLGLIQVFPSPYEQSSYAVGVSESSITVPSFLYLVVQNVEYLP